MIVAWCFYVIGAALGKYIISIVDNLLFICLYDRYNIAFVACESLQNVTCNSDPSCYIDCNHIDCQNKFIISSESVNELSVSCSSSKSCLGTTILCPNGNCLINCNSLLSCYTMNIYAYQQTNLFLDCEFGSTCSSMNINADIANNVSITCKMPHYMNPNQPLKAICNHIDIDANNVNEMVYIECIASDSTDAPYYPCNGLSLQANYANKVIVHNMWSYANMNGIIHANYSTKFNISCSNEYSEPSCSGLILSGSADSATLICEGYGCGELSLYSENGITDWTFDFNGCGLCDMMDNKCIGNNFWYIYCDINDTYLQHVLFTGSGYFFYYTQFCRAVTSITNGFYNEKKSCSIHDDNGNQSNFNLLDIDADIIFPAIFVIFIVLPFIGLLYFNINELNHEASMKNKPSIAILRYILCANCLIIIAYWNLIYISMSEKMFVFPDDRYFVLLIAVSAYTLIELVRTIDGCTFQTVCEPFPAFCYECCDGIKPEINEQRIFRLSDSLLTHIFISFTNKATKNKLIFEYYNMRKYWNFKNVPFIITTFLNVLIWNISLILQYERFIKWFQIYPIIALFFVIIGVKIKYRKGTPYQDIFAIPLAPQQSQDGKSVVAEIIEQQEGETSGETPGETPGDDVRATIK
eukprot:458186_1